MTHSELRLQPRHVNPRIQDKSAECETVGTLQILWNLWELHRFAKVLQICETGVVEKQEAQRPDLLADMEEIYGYPKDTSTGVSEDLSEKCLLGEWLIEEPYALIGHVRFCEGLLRLEPLIAKQYMMKGSEKSRQSLLDEPMKWTNRGHEYDDVYREIKKITGFYLFGAGDYGRQFCQSLGTEIAIKGYIDNDSKKQGKKINGIPCYALCDIKLEETDGIIVTMSQIARVKPVEQLKQAGHIRNKDYFIIEEFIAVYYAYKHDKVYFSSISFLPSTACNLNCEKCLNFNPYAKHFYVREWEALVRDVDLFFACVDHIMLFHVSGGEPMLYKHTADLIEYIDNNYGDRIDTLRTVTNGTVIPNEDILKKLSKCKVEVTVDDYREAVPQYNKNFDELIHKLEEYHIKYFINKVDSWIDLAPDKTDHSLWSEVHLEAHRESCNQSWQELRDGKLYSCNYAAYATVAGIAGEQDIEEVYDLRKYTPDRKKELIEFRLGFTTKGYTNFCKKCRGFTSTNTEEFEPAIQAR